MTSKAWDDFVKRSSAYTKYTPVNTFNYAINVSLKNKYIYIETPKVACSTIKLTLQGLELENPNFTRDDFQLIHDRAFSPLLKLQQLGNFDRFLHRSDFFKFCFVRNPYTRLLSAYLDKIVGNSAREKSNILKHMNRNPDEINQHISFEEFVSAIETQTPIMMDNHWRHQYYSTYQDMIRYNYIGKLESFDHDFNLVLQKLGASNYYKHENRHATNSISRLSKYYTSDLYKRVYKIYQLDFETFAYNKNAPIT